MKSEPEAEITNTLVCLVFTTGVHIRSLKNGTKTVAGTRSALTLLTMAHHHLLGVTGRCH